MGDNIRYRRAFEFNDEVAEVFDDMLERSIPDYRGMRDLVDHIGLRFAPGHGSKVLGIGTSLGRDVDTFAMVGCEVTSCEVSEPMARRQRERFKAFANVDVRTVDVTTDMPVQEYDLVIAVLTLQFIRPEDRDGVVAGVYGRLRDGGALLLVEKVIGESWAIEGVLRSEYERQKGRNGYTTEQIENKKDTLAFVMQPYKASQNEAMLRQAGFRHVDCFWRELNFAGWLAVK